MAHKMKLILNGGPGRRYYITPTPKNWKGPTIQNGRYTSAHRLVMVRKLRRQLRPDECVCAKDGNILNIKLSNLILLKRSQINQFKVRNLKTNCECQRCGKKFRQPKYRLKKGYGKFCSFKCRYPKSVHVYKGNKAYLRLKFRPYLKTLPGMGAN